MTELHKEIIVRGEDLISVVVFVRNETDNIERCYKNLAMQTYSNLQIIFIGTLNKENNRVLQNYKKVDKRIKQISTVESQNFYLFMKSAIKNSTGKYLVFLSSDDYISVDWVRMIWKKAKTSDADITISNLMKYTNDIRYYYNLDPVRITDILNNNLQDKSIQNYIGRCESCSSLYNKMYSRDCIIKSLNTLCENIENVELLKNNEFLEMLFVLENIVHAQRIVNVHNVEYFSNEKNLINKNTDSISELLYVWKKYKQKIEYYDLVKNVIYYFLKEILKDNTETNQIYLLEYMDLEDNIEEFEKFDSDYLSSIKTVLDPIYDEFERIKTQIAESSTNYVSFDIFDTLILRNVLEPTDIFHFLSKDFNELLKTDNYIDFKNIRVESESACRERLLIEKPTYEDVTLDEIYEQMQKDFNIPDIVVETLKKKELELELRLCIERKTGKELYELAAFCEKKIICISDMYLPLNIVAEILKKNGYMQYNNIFISSDIRLGKYTCNLYRYVKNKLNIESEKEIIHIGDNWVSDIENSKKCGFSAGHLAKPLDLFKTLNPGIYMGTSYEKIFRPNGNMIDGGCAFDLYSGIRCMLALTVNKFYDSPYVNFNHESDFNANPYLIGYFCVGMHTLAVAEWLKEDAKINGYKTIHFLGRDGYLPLNAYQKIIQDDDVPVAKYTYMSRYIIPLCDIHKPQDIYNLIDKMNVLEATPKKIIEIFNEVINREKFENKEALCNKAGFLFEKKLSSYNAAYKFLTFLADSMIDYKLLSSYHEKLYAYFTNIFKEDECIFDMGYNGRVESALNAICGYPVDAYYIHAYKELAFDRAKKSNFKIKTFYDYQPVSTFLIREQIFSKIDASVRNIRFDDLGNASLEMGKKEFNFETEYTTFLLQNAAIEFVDNFVDVYDDLRAQLNWRKADASLPFEFYLHNSASLDREFFKCVTFEDDFGDGIKYNLYEFWQNNLSVYKLSESSKEKIYQPEMIINSNNTLDIYEDGLFMSFYKRINKLFPLGSKKREILKYIVSVGRRK